MIIEENTSKKTKQKKFKTDNKDGEAAWADVASTLLNNADEEEDK